MNAAKKESKKPLKKQRPSIRRIIKKKGKPAAQPGGRMSASQEYVPNRLGVALVISAPSGAGKSTLVKRLMTEFPRFSYSVSYTTRPPRQDEEHGKDYYFTSNVEFDWLKAQGFFAEWARVHGNQYGTPLPFVADQLAKGRDLLFDIDVQGAAQLKEKLSQASFVFILPPSQKELARRLQGRGTDDKTVIARRLANAAQELAQADMFQSWIINDNLEQAYSQLKAVYIAETLRPGLKLNLIKELLAQWS